VSDQIVDQVMEACKVWAQLHHRTSFTVAEASHIRRALTQRLRALFKPAPDQVELVTIAHRECNRMIDARRDTAQKGEHSRMARA
jgi:hypothetical protein